MTKRGTDLSGRITRRGLLAAGGAATIALSGCTGGTGSTGGDTLRVSAWSGTYETVFAVVVLVASLAGLERVAADT